jgi:trk system potassium uptake protein TrkA
VAHGIQGEGRVIGKRIEEIPLPEGATIAAIVRGEEVLIAHHDTVVQRDDHVILFLTDRRQVDAVERLFDVPRRRR